jgi:hypothetical protein
MKLRRMSIILMPWMAQCVLNRECKLAGTHCTWMLHAVAISTTCSILNVLKQPLPEHEEKALYDAIFRVVKLGLLSSYELYRLRLEQPSSN